MEERDAQEITRMVEAAWGYDYGEKGRKLWREMLLPFEADLATKAVARLAARQRERPTIADLRQMILAMRADMRAKMLPETAVAPQYATPEWVYVWWWARRTRAPRNLVPFPQQKGFVDDALCMKQDEYEALKEEWVAAGAPTSDFKSIIAGVSEPKQPDYVTRTIQVLQEVADESP